MGICIVTGLVMYGIDTPFLREPIPNICSVKIEALKAAMHNYFAGMNSITCAPGKASSTASTLGWLAA